MAKAVSFSSGRLGNLLFSAASGKYYADKHGYDFYLLRNDGHDNFLKTVEKTILKNIKIINSIDKRKFEIIPERRFYDPIKRRSTDNIFIDGYRESPKYWNNDKEFIYKLFPMEVGLEDAIREAYGIDFSKYVCINVRRGDYLKPDVKKRLGLLSVDFFYKCMEYFPVEQKYIIVSDDLEWCKEMFVGGEFLFADKEIKGYSKTLSDLCIQTLCSSNIISNSTFSWWGAYLNKNKGRKVYYPNRFFRSVSGTMEKIPENDNWISVPAIWDDESSKKTLKDLVLDRSKRFGFNLNVTNPLTIQDKLAWLKIYDVTPLKTKCSDKYLLHEYCKEKVGKDICVPIIGVYNSTSEIDWNSLPNAFVAKCNHGSGMNAIVRDKSKADKKKIFSDLESWLKIDHSTRICYEMHYKNIQRKIIIEELLEDTKQTTSLVDYKFWCFNGVPKLYTTNVGNGNGDIMYYKIDGTPFDLYGTRSEKMSKPKSFDKMKEYAEILSKDFKFVRVDFYEVNGKLYLGELTFVPGAGLFKYKERKYDIMVGNMLRLTNNKKVIYTCITGNYDTLSEPKFSSKDWDFVCYTDTPESIKSNVWQVRTIPDSLTKLSKQKKQRYIKINAHEFFPDYDISIYVDANVELLKNPDTFISTLKADIALPKHPTRNCIYKEVEACLKVKKDTPENMYPQIERYKEEGFPEDYGLTQNNIIIRRHNKKDCIKLMTSWWKEVEKGSYRDQLSFYYSLWKTGVKIDVLDKTLCDGPYFKWRRSHKKISQAKEILYPKPKSETTRRMLVSAARRGSAVSRALRVFLG